MIYNTHLSLKALSTLIAEDADSYGYHVAFKEPCCTLDLSTNLIGERSFSSVNFFFVGTTSLYLSVFRPWPGNRNKTHKIYMLGRNCHLQHLLLLLLLDGGSQDWLVLVHGV